MKINSQYDAVLSLNLVSFHTENRTDDESPTQSFPKQKWNYLQILIDYNQWLSDSCRHIVTIVTIDCVRTLLFLFSWSCHVRGGDIVWPTGWSSPPHEVNLSHSSSCSLPFLLPTAWLRLMSSLPSYSSQRRQIAFFSLFYLALQTFSMVYTVTHTYLVL